MVVVSGLTKFFGSQTLFSDVSLQFTPGNRYGLVGANGSGKSTFLRMLTGEEQPNEGVVSIPNKARVGFLKQDHYRYEDNRILDVVVMGNQELWDAMVAKDELLAKDDFDGERYAELEDVITRHDGYTQEARAGEILEGLGIPTESHTQPLRTLSGGFKLRVLLAQVLAAKPDVLLLDEPTNHLDILSIRWLEKFLQNFAGTAVLVSHDHRFLDNVCTHIVDVDYETLTLYHGNYTDFDEAKVENRDRKEAEIAKQEKKIAEQKEFVERFRAKATKARQAQSKLKMIERVKVEKLPVSSRRYPVFKVVPRRPSGKQVLVAKGITKSFGERNVLRDVSLEVLRGDRLAIIGPNGIGKSTLLKIVMNKLEADGGSNTWGYETHPGWFPQDHRDVLGEARVDLQSWLWEFCPGEPIGFVRGQLAQVLFSGDDVKKKIPSLSGGEGARLVFARLAIEKPNVLVLDEPTNHLDLEAIEALVNGLEAFDGTLMFVSHDRWFVARLANRILEITPNGLRDFRGTYEEYIEKCGDDHLDSDAVALRAKREKTKAKRVAESPRGEGAARRKELEGRREEATRGIDEAERRIHEIDELFVQPGYFAKAPPAEVRKLETEQKDLKVKIEGLMSEWEGLEKELAEA